MISLWRTSLRLRQEAKKKTKKVFARERSARQIQIESVCSPTSVTSYSKRPIDFVKRKQRLNRGFFNFLLTFPALSARGYSISVLHSVPTNTI